jgi:hypothetical protein
MKKIILASVVLLASSAIFAQTSTNSTTSANTAASQALGGSQGQSLSVDNHEQVGGTRYAANTAIAPALTSGLDTCMGSSSAGASGMSFGLSLGSTWTDKNCVMLKNARELWNMGQHAASMAMLCTNEDVRYSISVSGGLMDKRSDGSIIRLGCPMTKKQWVAAGMPLLDPETGSPVQSGSVVVAATK